MIIEPKLKGSLALTSHPLGAYEFVKRQIDYVKKQEKYTGPKKVLIIGSSSGYGLASRISLAFGASADTIGVAFEKVLKENVLEVLDGGIPLPYLKKSEKKD